MGVMAGRRARAKKAEQSKTVKKQEPVKAVEEKPKSSPKGQKKNGSK